MEEIVLSKYPDPLSASAGQGGSSSFSGSSNIGGALYAIDGAVACE